MDLLESPSLPRVEPSQLIDSAESFRSRLRSILLGSFDGSRFPVESFFSLWFQTHGAGYVFLFKKNLRVTNIQFAELLALIRCHITDRRTGGSFTHIQFMAIKDFEETFRDVLNSFLPSTEPAEEAVDQAIDQFLELYSRLLERIVIVQPFFGSCTVFVPAHLALDLFSTCAYSGYIHSCGPLLYLADLTKATTHDLLEALDTHTRKYPLANGKKRKFIIYTHEDFHHDEGDRSSVQNGLADVRIYIDKFYIGGRRLADLPDVVEERCGEQISPVGVADFQKKKTDNWREPRTLWLIMDRAIEETVEHPGPNCHYVCYEQIYKNENQFHIFDESKPAWRAAVTIPHTLASAMINITRPYWPKDRAVDLSDPFCGSGTLYIEALKYPSLAVHSSDKDPVAPLLIRDNWHFFSMSSRQLEVLLRDLDQLLKEKALQKPNFIEKLGRTRKVRLVYEQALELLNGLTDRRRPADIQFDDLALRALDKMGLRGRFVFYLILRAALRNESAFVRGTEGWPSAFSRECQVMHKQIGRLRKVRQEQEAALRAGGREPGGNGVCTHASRFSSACSVSTHRPSRAKSSKRVDVRAQVRDVRKLPADSYDLIITDPPYGFNTDERPLELAHLYSDALASMIRALRRGGQLVICLPARAYTGRQTPAFTQPSFVTRQVMVQADILGRDAVGFHYYPISPFLQPFRPPFYWESERSLRRGIAHFLIR